MSDFKEEQHPRDGDGQFAEKPSGTSKAKPKSSKSKPKKSAPEYLYHVTLTESVDAIKQDGIVPFKPSNWVKAGDGSRYGEGDLYAFSGLEDAVNWAAKMDWEKNKSFNTGKISIVRIRKGDGWKDDPANEIGLEMTTGLMREAAIKPEDIESSVQVTDVSKENPFTHSRDQLVERFQKAFDESKHPRDDDGKFGSGGDTAVSNLPLDKRGHGSLDSQIDAWKREDAAEKKATRKDLTATTKIAKDEAKELFAEFGDDLAQSTEDKNGIDKKKVMEHLDGLVKWEPKKALKLLKKFQEQQADKPTSTSQTDSPEFKNWFGKSQVVDGSGKPLVVYHGSRSEEDFDVFDRPSMMSAGIPGGHHFTERQEPGYSENRVYPVYLKMENPFIADMSSDEYSYRNMPTWEDANKGGHDGIVIRWLDPGNDQYIVRNASQIKSASGNKGSFDPDDERITHSQDQLVERFQKAFDESKIKRDDGGKFSEKAGGGAKAFDIDSAANRIDESMESMRRYMEDDPSEEQRDRQGLDQDAEFKDGVDKELAALANRYGFTVDRDYDSQSTYWDINLEIDGNVEESLQVRASNHKQRYGGTLWSFELQDDVKSIALGLKTIEDEMKSLKASGGGGTSMKALESHVKGIPSHILSNMKRNFKEGTLLDDIRKHSEENGYDPNLVMEYLERSTEKEKEYIEQSNAKKKHRPLGPQFKKWFGDSKVVDGDGNPLVMYHGSTGGEFTSFDSSKSGETSGGKLAEGGKSDATMGFFFTTNPKEAENWTYKNGNLVGHIKPVYLNVRNPLVVHDPHKGYTDRKFQADAIQRAIQGGHDGLIIKDTLGQTQSEAHRGDSIVVFSPSQIKSASGNKGSFDPEDDRINYNLADQFKQAWAEKYSIWGDSNVHGDSTPKTQTRTMGGGLTSGSWKPFRGKQGGRGWINTATGDKRYQTNKPGEGHELKEPSRPRRKGGVHEGQSSGEATTEVSPGQRPEGTQGTGGERGVGGLPSGDGKQRPRQDVPTDRRGAEPDDGKVGRDKGDDAPARKRRIPKPRNLAAGNFSYRDTSSLGGGLKTKFKRNLAAIEVIQDIEREGRDRATLEEQKILSQFTGWGQFSEKLWGKGGWGHSDWRKEIKQLKILMGEEEFDRAKNENKPSKKEAAAKRATQNSHFTDPRIVQAHWQIAQRLGFNGGRYLDPSIGSGYYVGMMPPELASRTAVTGVELDDTTAKVAKYLYPSATIRHQGFQNLEAPDGFYDLVASNVPFGDYTVHDQGYNKFNAKIHDYFFLKSIDKVRPGGLVMHVTSAGTMDKKKDRIRKELAGKADLVSAIRLPTGTHKGVANTDVVTDLLIFRKHGENGPAGSDTPDAAQPDKPGFTGVTVDSLGRVYHWIDGKRVPADRWTGTTTIPNPNGEGEIPINQYFADRPEQVLGTPNLKGSMYGGPEEMSVAPPEDFEAALQAAIERVPEGIYNPDETSKEAFSPQSLLAPDEMREGNLTIQDGKLLQRQSGGLIEVKASRDYIARIEAMLPIVAARRALVNAEMAGEDATEARERLNQAYDAFKEKFGLLTDKANRKAIAVDPDAPVLASLETVNKETKEVEKTDIFSKDTIRRLEPVEKVDSVSEGIGVSLNQKGRIDIEHIAKLTGKEIGEIEDDLYESGVAFNDPALGWMPRDEYLSGNVRRKLEEAIVAADSDPRFKANVVALEASQPEYLEYTDISARMGAPWIPPAIIDQFAGHVANTKAEYFSSNYDTLTNTWEMNPSSGNKFQTENASTRDWGLHGHKFTKIFDAALNNKQLNVNDTVVDESGKERRVVNREQTQEVRQKVQDLKDEFSDWLWEDDDRRQELTDRYNENFNSIVEYHPDGSHLTFPGMNPNLNPYDIQRNFVWQMIKQGKGYAGHEVGTGKTVSMIASAMELRRLGLAKKPCIAALKPTISQLTQEALDLYPGAKILSTSDMFTAKDRKETVARIASGDYDMVIMTHEHLDMLPMGIGVQQRFIEEEIEELDSVLQSLEGTRKAGGFGERKPRTVKNLEKQKDRLRARLEKALDSKKDDALTFEETGIDMLFVDEAHKYKNIPLYTAQDIKGVPTSNADRAGNMLMRSRWLQEQTGGRGLCLVSGTPVANTMAEIYNIQKYLQPEELRERGIYNFDAWAATFGETVSELEPALQGGYKTETRMSKFTNVADLLNMSGMDLDIQRADAMLDHDGNKAISRPIRKDNQVATPETDSVKAMMVDVQRRAQAASGRKPEKGEDNALSITQAARVGSVDPRLYSADFPDEPDSKANQCVRSILEGYHNPSLKGNTQLIFSDTGVYKSSKTGFHLYKDVIDKLVKGGIPRDQIADFSTMSDKAKYKAVDKLKRGEMRIGIGSTQKMGTGVNVQDHLSAIHHLDIPYRPGDLEQRNGRGWRKGNKNKEINIYNYSTKGSADELSWQIIARKIGFINQVNSPSGRRVREIVEEDTSKLNPEQLMAAASGDIRTLRRMELRNDVTSLRKSKDRHDKNTRRIRDNIGKAKADIISLAKKSKRHSKDAKLIKDTDFSLSITHGQKDDKASTSYADRPDAGKALKAATEAYDTEQSQKESWQRATEPEKIGTYKGLELRRAVTGYVLVGASGEEYDTGNSMRSVEAVARGIGKKGKDAESQLKQTKSDIVVLIERGKKAFTRDEDLINAQAALKKLEKEMRSGKSPVDDEGNSSESYAKFDERRRWGNFQLYAQAEKQWTPFVGPRGGRGWRSSTGEVTYGDRPGTRGAGQDEPAGRRGELTEGSRSKAKKAQRIEQAEAEWQERKTRSRYFKGWFGDWENDPGNASKVVDPETGEPAETANVDASKVQDENGEPVLVYHGTAADFESFDLNLADSETSLYGPGFYFAEQVGLAESYLVKASLQQREDTGERWMTGRATDEDHNFIHQWMLEKIPDLPLSKKGVEYAERISEAAKNKDSEELKRKLAGASVEFEGRFDGIIDSMMSEYVKVHKKEKVLSCYLNIRKPFNLEEKLSSQWIVENFSEGLLEEIKGNFGNYDSFSGREMYFVFKENIDRQFGRGYGGKVLNEKLAKMGYDGITVDLRDQKVWIAFQPNQVKSTDNRGTFDNADDRMAYSESNRWGTFSETYAERDRFDIFVGLYAKQQGLFDESKVNRDGDGQFATKGSSAEPKDDGFDLKNKPNSSKGQEFHDTKSDQRQLLSGLDALPGQQDLFADVDVEEDLSAKAEAEWKKRSVRSKYFKGWFGDWEKGPGDASKVVDDQTKEPAETTQLDSSKVTEDGMPVLVHHGTVGDYEAFDIEKSNPDSLYGPGFYFSQDDEIAGEYTQKAERQWEHDFFDRLENNELTDKEKEFVFSYLKKYAKIELKRQRRLQNDNRRDLRQSQRLTDVHGHVIDDSDDWDDDDELEGHTDEDVYQAAVYEDGEMLAKAIGNRDEQRSLFWSNNILYEMSSSTDLVPKHKVNSCYLNIRNPVDATRPITQEEANKLADVIENIQGQGDFDAIDGDDSFTRAARELRRVGEDVALSRLPNVYGGMDISSIYGCLDNISNLIGKKTGAKGTSFARQLPLSKSQRVEILKAAGYDGITHTGGTRRGANLHKVWIAFSPNQIKSVENRGTFDPSDDRMDYSKWGDSNVHEASGSSPTFKESDHPRSPKGTGEGGQFTAGGSSALSSSSKGDEAKSALAAAKKRGLRSYDRVTKIEEMIDDGDYENAIFEVNDWLLDKKPKQVAPKEPKKDGNRVGAEVLGLKDIKADPSRFQYKVQDIDSQGVTTEFSDVEYDPLLAGMLYVWEDPDSGETYVINGHHRYEIAVRSGYEGNVPVYFMDAANEKEARALGAIVNIAEGHGTALDAAKFMRDMKKPGQLGVDYLKSKNVSLKGKISSDALLLSGLSDAVFRDLSYERMTLGQALAIAGPLQAARDASEAETEAIHDAQNEVLKAVRSSSRKVSDEAIREMAEDAMASPMVQNDDGPSLFGDDETFKKLMVDRGEIKSSIRKELSKIKSRFAGFSVKGADALAAKAGVGEIDREKAIEKKAEATNILDLFETEVRLKGEVGSKLNEIINRAAEEHNGKRNQSGRQKVKDRAKREVREFLKSLQRSESGEARPDALGSGGYGQPSGAVLEGSAYRLDRGVRRYCRDGVEQYSKWAPDAKVWVSKWSPYVGPRGGKGWKNTETGEVVYGDKPGGRKIGTTKDKKKDADYRLIEPEETHTFASWEQASKKYNVPHDSAWGYVHPSQGVRFGNLHYEHAEFFEWFNVGGINSEETSPDDIESSDKVIIKATNWGAITFRRYDDKNGWWLRVNKLSDDTFRRLEQLVDATPEHLRIGEVRIDMSPSGTMGAYKIEYLDSLTKDEIQKLMFKWYSSQDSTSETRSRYSKWSPYVGPRGGKGWTNTETGEVIYGDRPGERKAALKPAKKKGKAKQRPFRITLEGTAQDFENPRAKAKWDFVPSEADAFFPLQSEPGGTWATGKSRSYYKITRVEDGIEAIISVGTDLGGVVFHVRQAKHDETDLSEFVNDWKSFHKLPRITTFSGGHSYRGTVDPFAAAMDRREAKEKKEQEVPERVGNKGLKKSMGRFQESVDNLRATFKGNKEAEDTAINFEASYKEILPNLGYKAANALSRSKVILHRNVEDLNDEFSMGYGNQMENATVGGWFSGIEHPMLNLTYSGLKKIGLNPHEVIAHEVTHAIDCNKDGLRPGSSRWTYSSTSEWRKAWREEIGDKVKESWVMNKDSKSELCEGVLPKDIQVGDFIWAGRKYGFRKVTSTENIKGLVDRKRVMKINLGRSSENKIKSLHSLSHVSPRDKALLTENAKHVDPKRARLGHYATTKANEGFAEFGALVLTDPEYAKKTCPKCWAVWEKFKLINPDAKSSKRIKTRREEAQGK